MSKSHKVSIMALSCSEASRLASESLDRELTRRERWALWFHTRLCAACRRFVAHLRTLRGVVDSMPAKLRQQWRDQALRLSAERRAIIKRLLAEANQSDS